MLKYILKRLGLSILILFGVSLIIYFLVRLMPTDYLTQKFSSQLQQGTISLDDIERFKAIYGLSDNSFLGILKGYFNWVGNLARGELGDSFLYEVPVAQVISSNMGISFIIAFIAMIFQFAISIPLGISSATHQYSIRDYTVTVLAMIGISLPSYFFAALLIRVFASELGWFPVSGLVSPEKFYTDSFPDRMRYILDIGHHLVLPMIVLVVLSIGGLMRYTRTNTLEVLNADYIRTARAKGLSEKKVIYVHAFRNTMIPLVTLLAGILPSLFGGAMITEEVFGINGIGKLAYDALKAGDIPFIMGYNMFLAVLTVIGTLLSDLMYAVVDPRVKLGK
ncbi:MAG: ABC transporter permease [Prevotella sp.]|nr:ABC transporter permease [Staphylococcus sp.]MCM1349695.1 ABC transporter permease [Prevotella sp.]